MKKLFSLVSLVVMSAGIFSGCALSKKPPTEVVTSSTVISSSPLPINTDFTARFEIFTNSTKRIFTDPMYHNQSREVYIESSDPHLIYVKKTDLTWNDFFSTLPFSLKKDCLVTGTKQTFCNTEKQKLHFYLNDQEDPDALEKVMKPNDLLRVEYKGI